MSILDTIAAGHTNIALTIEPGLGIVTAITDELRESGGTVCEIQIDSLEDHDFTYVISEFDICMPHPALTEGETVVLSSSVDTSDAVFKIITEVISNRVIAGMELDTLANVILVTYGEDERVNELIASGAVTPVAFTVTD